MRVTLDVDPDWSVAVVSESLRQDLEVLMKSYSGSYFDCNLIKLLLGTLQFYTTTQDYQKFLREFTERCVKGLPDNDRLWRVLFPDEAAEVVEDPEEPSGC